MSVLIVISLLILVVVWGLLAIFGKKLLVYLSKYDEETYDQKLDEYLRKRYEKFHLEHKQRMKNNPFLNQNEEIEEIRIVGIRKPIGKWTKMVTMRNLEHIGNFKRILGSKISKGMGFWQLKVRGYDEGAGKAKGRGR